VFRPLDVALICLVGYRDSDIRLRLDPHFGVGYFLNIVQSIVPDRRMWIVELSFENLEKLELHRVSGRVSNSSFGRNGKDKVILDLRGALLDGTDNILPDIARQPLVDRIHLGAKSLKLVDCHWTNFEKTSR